MTLIYGRLDGQEDNESLIVTEANIQQIFRVDDSCRLGFFASNENCEPALQQ